MNHIQVKSLPLGDVLQDIASVWKVELTEDCKEFTVRMPEDIGSGFIKGINFSGGLGLIRYDCTFKEDTEILFDGNKIHPLKFLNCKEGQVKHYFEESEHDGESQLKLHENVIVASTQNHGHKLAFMAGEKTRIDSLEVNRKVFMDEDLCENKGFNGTMDKVFSDVEASHKFSHRGLYNINLDDIFQSIDDFSEDGILRYLFLKSKAYDILVFQILLYEDDALGKGKQKMLRKAEVANIAEAAALIQDNMGRKYSVEELSRAVGVNPNKLQDGFKKIKGMTVNDFVRDVKLSAARQLLIADELDVSEIVYAMGYTNRGYFAKLFGEKYGLTPTEFRAQYKKSHRVKSDLSETE